MPKILERRIPLDGGDDFLDVRLFIERGKLVGFVLNYTAVIGDEPREVCRYDTCHGHLHVHRGWVAGAPVRDLEDPRRPAADYDERLTRAQKDIAENWRQYRANMELMERATEQREG